MRDLPRVAELEPFVRLFDLIAVDDALVEDPEVVAEPITDRRQVHRGHRIEEAGGEPAEPAIAESGVHLVIAELVPIQPLLRHGLAADVFHLEIDHIVAQQPADQELEREIVDALDVLLVMGLLGGHPAFDHPVPHHPGQGEVAVPVRRRIAVPRQGITEVVGKILPHAFDRHRDARVTARLLPKCRLFIHDFPFGPGHDTSVPHPEPAPE